MKCTIDNCPRKYHARGFCSLHYERLRRFGDPLRCGSVVVGDDEKRFWSHVDKTPTCWFWKGSLTQGYGYLKIKGKNTSSHRFSYELLREKIPFGKVLDHLCRTRSCVNPDHLEVVSNKENILRGVGLGAIESRMVNCKYGHPLQGNNLYIRLDGKRRCRLCNKNAAKEWRGRTFGKSKEEYRPIQET